MKAIPILGTIVAALGFATSKAAGAVTDTPAPAVPFDEMFTRHCLRYDCPKRLAVAVVAHESRFNPRAVNEEAEADRRRGRDVDSLGLGQILFPDTASDYGIKDRERLFDPDTNLSITVRHLAKRLKRYPVAAGTFPADAVSAYNGGHSLRTTGGAFVNQEYVDKVRAQWERFAGV